MPGNPSWYTSLNLRIVLLILAPAFVGCENPVEPPDRPDPAEAIAAAVESDAHTLLHLRFNGDLKSADGESPTRAAGLTFGKGVSGSGVLIDGTDVLKYKTSGNFTAAAGTMWAFTTATSVAETEMTPSSREFRFTAEVV